MSRRGDRRNFWDIDIGKTTKLSQAQRHQQIPRTVLCDLPSKRALDEHIVSIESRARHR
jgi:hypothetical protein